VFRSILLSGCALLCAAPVITALPARPALAQRPEATTTLDPVTVTAPPTGSLTVAGPEEQRRAVLQTPGGVTFVDAESYTRGYANNLRDVLKDAPGVYAQNRYGQELHLSVRGSGLARDYHTRGIEILQDGIPTNLADGIGDFYQIDPLGLRWVEVYRGGNALPFGSTALGGAINFVTPTAYTAVAPNIAGITGGSFGTIQGHAQVSRVLGDFDFLIGGTVSHADGFRRHMRQQYEQFNANVGYRISPNVETRFYAGIYITDQKLPGTLTLRQALNNPTRASASALAGDEARNVHTERIANRTTVALENGRLDFDSWFIHQSLYHPIFMVLDYDGYTYGLAPRYTGTFQVGGMRDELVIGGRLFGGNNRVRWYFNNHGSRAGQSLNARQDATNLEAYVENRLFFLPTLAFVTGAKAYHANRDYTDYGGLPLSRAPYRTQSDRDYDGINPKIGLLWEPRKDVQAFVNVTRSADVPDFLDLTQFQPGGAAGFVPLKAQRAWTLEAGTRGKQDRFAWDVTFYRSWVDGQLLQYTVDPSVPATTFNAGRTVLQGIELGASLDIARDLAAPGDQLTVAQLWNFSDFSFRNDRQYGDNTLPGIPRHVLRTSLTYSHPAGFFIAPVVDWVPQGAWVDYANTRRVPSYALLGLRAGARVAPGIDLSLDARNLTNKRYISDFGPVTQYSPAGTNTFYPGDGASVYVGLRARF
jgi:iron complex outermembrane receptor protein